VLNAALQSENDELNAKLAAASSSTLSPQDASEVEELTLEFQQRLAVIEKKLIAVTNERNGLRHDLASALHDLESKDSMLNDKEETIATFQKEGEDLARKAGELEALSKKLRSDLQDETAEKSRLRDQLESLKKQMGSGGKAGGAPSDGTPQDATDGLGSASQASSSKVKFLSDELEREKERSAAKLRSLELQLEEDRKREVADLREREYELVEKVQQLQDALMDVESNAAEREEALRKENRLLEHRQRQAEAKAEDAVQSIADNAKPYVEEIEALREAATRSGEERQRVEADLRRKIADSESNARIQEGKLLAAETLALSSEDTVEKLKQKVAEANAQAEEKHQSMIAAVKRDAEARHEMESLVRENEKLRKIERELQESHQRSMSDSLNERQIIEQKYSGIIKSKEDLITKQKGELENLSVRDLGHRSDDGAEAIALEGLLNDSHVNWNLARQMDRDTGEVQSLRQQLAHSEETRVKSVEECSKLQEEVNELKERCAAAVTLVGEGEERIEQLEEDITEMKAIFHQQIDIMANELQKAKENPPDPLQQG